MTEEEKRLTNRVSILRGMLSPFVCAIYNGQAHDWDHEAVFSMFTDKDELKGEDLPARLAGIQSHPSCKQPGFRSRGR